MPNYNAIVARLMAMLLQLSQQPKSPTVTVQQLRIQQALHQVVKKQDAMKRLREAQAQSLNYDLRNMQKRDPWRQKFGQR